MTVDDESGVVRAETLGHIASYYYLQYTTVALFCAELHDVDAGPTELPTLLRVLCDASEFDELPVRHNEEHVNAQMARELPWRVDEASCDSPHVKAQLLLQVGPTERSRHSYLAHAPSSRPLPLTAGLLHPLAQSAGALCARRSANERLRD